MMSPALIDSWAGNECVPGVLIETVSPSTTTPWLRMTRKRALKALLPDLTLQPTTTPSIGEATPSAATWPAGSAVFASAQAVAGGRQGPTGSGVPLRFDPIVLDAL